MKQDYLKSFVKQQFQVFVFHIEGTFCQYTVTIIERFGEKHSKLRLVTFFYAVTYEIHQTILAQNKVISLTTCLKT